MGAVGALVLVAGVWWGPALISGRVSNDAATQPTTDASRGDRNIGPSITLPAVPGLKPDEIQAELDRAWQATLNAEARLPGKAVEQRYRGTDEIHWLDGQLQRLEREMR